MKVEKNVLDGFQYYLGDSVECKSHSLNILKKVAFFKVTSL